MNTMRILIETNPTDSSTSDLASPSGSAGIGNSSIAGSSEKQGNGNSQEIDLYDENIAHDFSCAKFPVRP